MAMIQAEAEYWEFDEGSCNKWNLDYDMIECWFCSGKKSNNNLCEGMIMTENYELQQLVWISHIDQAY